MYKNPKDMDFPEGKISDKAQKPKRQQVYLDSLRLHGIHAKAAKDAGVSYNATHGWRVNDPEFEAKVQEALEEAVADAEFEMRTRAVKGVEYPVFYKGEPVYLRNPLTGELVLDENFQPTQLTSNVRSDRLLEVYMKAHRPMYRDKSGIEMSGPDGGPIRTADMTEEELDERLKQYGLSAHTLEE